jgi:hypothetical protein
MTNGSIDVTDILELCVGRSAMFAVLQGYSGNDTFVAAISIHEKRKKLQMTKSGR